jgi:hypothetical protein
MKKVLFAAFLAVTGFAANAQSGGDNGGSACTGCTALTYDACQTHVTVSLANTLNMNCTSCSDMQACANSISEWANGISLGTATFAVQSTKPFSVYGGLASGTMAKNGGGTGLTIGSGSANIQINAKVTGNMGGTYQSTYNTAPTPLAVRTSNSTPYTAANSGSKLIGAAPANVGPAVSTSVALSTGPIPVSAVNGDYSVDIIFAAIQD